MRLFQLFSAVVGIFAFFSAGARASLDACAATVGDVLQERFAAILRVRAQADAAEIASARRTLAGAADAMARQLAAGLGVSEEELETLLAQSMSAPADRDGGAAGERNHRVSAAGARCKPWPLREEYGIKVQLDANKKFPPTQCRPGPFAPEKLYVVGQYGGEEEGWDYEFAVLRSEISYQSSGPGSRAALLFMPVKIERPAADKIVFSFRDPAVTAPQISPRAITVTVYDPAATFNEFGGGEFDADIVVEAETSLGWRPHRIRTRVFLGNE